MFAQRIHLVEREHCKHQVWDAANLIADLQSCESLEQANRIYLRSGSDKVLLSELFAIAIEPSDQFEVLLEVKSLIFNRLGYRMQSGQVQVFGDVGDQVGYSMRGGTIVIHGSAGDFVGAGMRGGLAKIMGDVGHYLAGPSTETGVGMRGGDILVKGNAGNFVAERMRRGVVFIEGSAGSGGANHMIAGTVVVMQEIAAEWGNSMKRGSIILGKSAEKAWHASLSQGHEFELSFLPLLWKYLASLVPTESWLIPSTRWSYRQVGDLAVGGKGEVLTLTRTDR